MNLIQNLLKMNSEKLINEKFINAILDDNYKDTSELIKQGANVNTIICGSTALEFAVKNEIRYNSINEKSIVDLLLINNADIYQLNRSNYTVLQYVISTDERASLKKLIHYGADVNKVNSLIFATYNDHLHTVRILLQNNVDITMVDNYRNNAIMLATELDKPNALDIIKDICVYASNKYIDIINHKNKFGETALDLATNQEIKEYLISQGAKSYKKIEDEKCVICIYDKINVIMEPCNHMVCKACLSKINKCPFCRGEIKNFIYV